MKLPFGSLVDLMMDRVGLDRDGVGAGDRATELVGGQAPSLEDAGPLADDLTRQVDLACPHVVVLVEDVAVVEQASVADGARRPVVPDDIPL